MGHRCTYVLGSLGVLLVISCVQCFVLVIVT